MIDPKLDPEIVKLAETALASAHKWQEIGLFSDPNKIDNIPPGPFPFYGHDQNDIVQQE